MERVLFCLILHTQYYSCGNWQSWDTFFDSDFGTVVLALAGVHLQHRVTPVEGIAFVQNPFVADILDGRGKS